jgi:hypothetical protein
MVRNSEKTYGEIMKTYGEIMLEARAKTDHQEVGETVSPVMEKFRSIIEEIVQKEYERGTEGKYYIHIWVQKEPYTQNALRIYPQSRRTRPSPYQGHDHYLWSVENQCNVKFEWCIPSKEILTYILKNPHEFDAEYVRMLKSYCEDKIESLEDYRVGEKIM